MKGFGLVLFSVEANGFRNGEASLVVAPKEEVGNIINSLVGTGVLKSVLVIGKGGGKGTMVGGNTIGLAMALWGVGGSGSGMDTNGSMGVEWLFEFC